jgi:tRNA threonylcarbamoyl adenosine modification protein (Sua5/YciO/YrdC/YwlC family)
VNDALSQLAAGGVVAIATESFFGLLADATRADAIDRLLGLKPRGSEKGVPLILPDRASWSSLVQAVPPVAAALADAFWPAGLSLALPSRPHVDLRLTLGGSLAVRLPGASPAAELASAFGKPLTATSANQPGAPPATRADQVLASFPDAVRRGTLLVVPGESPGGAPSTLLAIHGEVLSLVREGAVGRSRVEAVLGPLGVHLDGPGGPR